MGDAEDLDQAVRLLHGGTALDHVAVLGGSSSMQTAGVVDTPLAAAQVGYGRLWTSYNTLRAAATARRPGGSVTLLCGQKQPPSGFRAGRVGTFHGGIEALTRAAALDLSPGSGLPRQLWWRRHRMARPLIRHQGSGDDFDAAALMSNPAITGALPDFDGGERLSSSPDLRETAERGGATGTRSDGWGTTVDRPPQSRRRAVARLQAIGGRWSKICVC